MSPSSSSSPDDDDDDDDDNDSNEDDVFFDRRATIVASSSSNNLPPPSPPVMTMLPVGMMMRASASSPNDFEAGGDSPSSSPMLSVKERIRLMQKQTDARKPSPPMTRSGGTTTSAAFPQQQRGQQPFVSSSLTSKVGALETMPRQLTPSFEDASEDDDAKKKKTKEKVATPLPKYTPYRTQEKEGEKEKEEEFQKASALIRQKSAPPPVSTTTKGHSQSPRRSPRSPTMRDRAQMFEQPVSISQRQAQMLKNLRLKIQANIEASEEIALRKKKMNDAIVNLRKVKSKLEQKHAYDGGGVGGSKTTTQFRKRIISKLVETEFEIETKAIMFNAWKIRTEKEKEKRDVVMKKFDAIRVVVLRRSFDHWRDVSASLQPRREALEALGLNARQRYLRDIFNRWRKFARLSHRSMHVAAMKTIDSDKKTLSIAFARWELALAKRAISTAEKKLVRAFVLKKTFIAWRMARDDSAFKVEVARRKLRGDSEGELVVFVDAWKRKTENERMTLYFRSEGSAARKKMERWKDQHVAATNYVTSLLPLATLRAPWDSFSTSSTDANDDVDDDRKATSKKVMEESKVDQLLREAKEAIQRADELRDECEFARNVAEDAENASDFLLVMFQQGKDVNQTHLSNALIHAEKMYGKFTLLSVECEKASAEAVRKVRKAQEAEKLAEKYEHTRLQRYIDNDDDRIPITGGELERNQPRTKTTSREIAVVFANRNVAKRFLQKWRNAVDILQRDRLELFFTSWREQTRKGLITRADREIQIEKFIEGRAKTMKAKVFSALYWHAKWRQDRKKVLENSVRPIARDSLHFAIKQWKIKIYNKKLLFRVFANCERLWYEKVNEPYDIENIRMKRDVLRVWLKNAKEAKKMRNDYVQATQFHNTSLKLNAFIGWKSETESSKRDALETNREREINEHIADTFRRVSLSQRVLRAWRIQVFNSWRERLAIEIRYRTIARKALRGWHRRVVHGF